MAPAARATILDLDRRGFAIPPGDGIAVDAMLLVDLPRLGVRQARVVRDGGSHFRCDWATPLSDGELAGLVPGRLDAAMLARPAPGYAEPDIARFPAIVRAGTVVGIALLLWLLIYTARRA